MSKVHWIIAGAAAVVVVGLLLTWLLRRRYFRERFAFASLMGILGLSTATIAAVLGQRTPWDLVALALSEAFGWDYEPTRPSIPEYVLALLTIAMVAAYSQYLFTHWDGKVSERQARNESEGVRSSITADAYHYVAQRDRDEQDKTRAAHAFKISAPPLATEPWHRAARTLVQTRWGAYAFEENSWLDTYRAWIGSEHLTNTRVVLVVRDTDYAGSLADERAVLSKIYPGEVFKLLLARDSEVRSAARPDAAQDDVSFTRADMLAEIVDPKAYASDVERRFAHEFLADSQLTVERVFVEPTVRSDTGQLALTSTVVESWLAESSRRHLAVLGDYGQGKSTMALGLVRSLLRDWNPERRLPLLIELRGTSPGNLKPKQLLAAWGDQWGMTGSALWELHRARRTILVFDGFDEISLLGDRQTRAQHFQALWNFATPGAKIVFTGRPNFFFDNSEMSELLGTEQGYGENPFCQVLHLQYFSSAEARLALRSYGERAREAIPRLMDSGGSFADLVSRPALLHVAAIVWDEIAAMVADLTPANVLEIFINRSYTRQGVKEETETAPFMVLNSSERAFFMSCVAADMGVRRVENQISSIELQGVIRKFLTVMPDAISRSPANTGERSESLRTRLGTAPEAVETISNDVRTTALLIADPMDRAVLRFGHKSFLEFLIGQLIAEQLSSEPTLRSRTICRHLGSQLFIRSLASPEVREFAAEMIAANMFTVPAKDVRRAMRRGMTADLTRSASVNLSLSMMMSSSGLPRSGSAFLFPVRLIAMIAYAPMVLYFRMASRLLYDRETLDLTANWALLCESTLAKMRNAESNS